MCSLGKLVHRGRVFRRATNTFAADRDTSTNRRQIVARQITRVQQRQRLSNRVRIIGAEARCCWNSVGRHATQTLFRQRQIQTKQRTHEAEPGALGVRHRSLPCQALQRGSPRRHCEAEPMAMGDVGLWAEQLLRIPEHGRIR